MPVVIHNMGDANSFHSVSGVEEPALLLAELRSLREHPSTVSRLPLHPFIKQHLNVDFLTLTVLNLGQSSARQGKGQAGTLPSR